MITQYTSAHVVHIEDSNGELVDLNYYCSDSCARSDLRYAGWNGCNEIVAGLTVCNGCGDRL